MADGSTTYAFDKQSARSFDSDGRMRVRGCTISVSEVNPYYGREIVGWKELGLDPNKVYDLYRDPDALSAAADSFNGPLMIRHIAQTAKEPRKDYQGGSVYNVRYEHPKLLADLLVSDGQAIEYIRSEMLADLSSSYRYKTDMTPGEIDGKRFDGRMVGIEGNHVALVEDGRATGAHVADSALSSQPGDPTVDPNENPNTAASGAGVAEALMLLTTKLEAIETRLTAVEGGKTQTPQSEAETGLPASVNTASDEQSEKDRKDERAGEERSEKDHKDEREGEERAMDAKSVQAVVDAALTAERARAKDVEDAKLACRPDLGDMIAMDNAGDVYRAALKTRHVDVNGMSDAVAKATYQALQSVARPVTHANDSRSGDKPAFNTSRIRRLGSA